MNILLLKLMVILMVSSGTMLGSVAQTTNRTVISNIAVGQVEVSSALLLTINPNINTPFPEHIIAGCLYSVNFDVTNPNNVSIGGFIALNITARDGSIISTEVYMFSGSSDYGVPFYVVYDGATESTLMYRLCRSADGVCNTFRSGTFFNTTWVHIQFNSAGNYDWTLAINQ